MNCQILIESVWENCNMLTERTYESAVFQVLLNIITICIFVGLVGSVLAFRLKARVRVPGQTSKRNTKSISSAISSQQISGKNSESK